MDHNKEWFSEDSGWFGQGYISEYEDIQTSDLSKKEVDFIESLCSIPNAMILDIPCGMGRHSLEFAKRGHVVTGYDLNGDFIKEAKLRADQQGFKVDFVKQDMRRLASKNTYDLVVNLFSSFGYFDTKDEDMLVLSKIYDSLKDDGDFIMDFINHDWLMRNPQTRDWSLNGAGDIILKERTYDPVQGKSYDRRIVITPKGERLDSGLSSLRLYTTPELILMCKEVGFNLLNCYGGYAELASSPEQKRTVLHFRKVK